MDSPQGVLPEDVQAYLEALRLGKEKPSLLAQSEDSKGKKDKVVFYGNSGSSRRAD